MPRVDPDALLQVGRVWRPHGVHGAIKVIPESDDPAHLLKLPTLYLGETPTSAVAFSVQTARMATGKKGPHLLIELDGVQGRDAATALRGRRVYALDTDLPPLADDEVYLHDLVGLAVILEDGTPVGVLDNILDLPAHHVYVVRRSDGHPDALIPAVPPFIVNIDLDAAQVVIAPIEGML
ncbi:MAG: ribosome maturation factor RimM [Bacteroidota bacterium]